MPRTCGRKQGLYPSFSLVYESPIYSEPLSLTFTSYLIQVTLRVTMLTTLSCNLTVMLRNVVPAPNSADLHKNPVSSHHLSLPSKCRSWPHDQPPTPVYQLVRSRPQGLGHLSPPSPPLLPGFSSGHFLPSVQHQQLSLQLTF